MVKKILKWNDERFDKLLADRESSDFKRCVKAFGIGAVEGAIDGLVIGSAVSLTIVAINGIVRKLKK